MIIRAICSFWRWCNYVFYFFPYIYLSIVYISVLFGDDASSSCGIEVKSVFFQDSLQLSGFVVSATLHLLRILSFSGVSVFFFSMFLFLISFADSRVQKKPKHCKLCLSRGILLMIMNILVHSFDMCQFLAH